MKTAVSKADRQLHELTMELFKRGTEETQQTGESMDRTMELVTRSAEILGQRMDLLEARLARLEKASDREP